MLKLGDFWVKRFKIHPFLIGEGLRNPAANMHHNAHRTVRRRSLWKQGFTSGTSKSITKALHLSELRHTSALAHHVHSVLD